MVVFSKKFKTSRLEFRVDVASNGCVSLVRLPELDIEELYKNGYNDSKQMCSVVKNTCVPKNIIWDNITEEEFLESLQDNSGHSTDNYTMMEFIGRDAASQNLEPDTAIDGFLEWELNVAMDLLDKDKEIARFIDFNITLDKAINDD